MALSDAILGHARNVQRDGLLKFGDPFDKVSLMAICRLAEEEINALVATRRAPWLSVHAHIVAVLKECDATCGWKTQDAFTGESAEQKQKREEIIYQMLATVYLLSTAGVRVGLP